MPVLFKIAFRNLRAHKVKTLIIGLILGLGMLILVAGNSLLNTATAGIKRNYIENFTGHIMITGSTESDITLFGIEGAFDESMPRIPQYFSVLEYVESHPAVVAVSPQVTGRATLQYGEDGMGFAMLFGVDPKRYFELFPNNLELVQGAFLEEGQDGIVLSEMSAQMIEGTSGQAPAVGDRVLLTASGGTVGTSIREVTVRGVFRFRNAVAQLNMVSLIDMQNLRSLVGLTVIAPSDLDLSEAEEALLGEVDEESLFGGGGEEDATEEEALFEVALETAETSGVERSEESFVGILGDTSKRDELSQTDTGSWHYLLVRLKDTANVNRVIGEFSDYFAGEGIDVHVADWLAGAGTMAEMVYGIKNIFNLIVLIIAVVAVIIIMNTLVISVSERIAEIGTMRAIGAHKSFVRRMVTFETLMISAVFGSAGIVIGGVLLGILNLTGLHSPSMFFQIIFGGEALHPVLSASTVAASLGMVLGVGVLASLYPVSIALRIQPVKAMQTE